MKLYVQAFVTVLSLINPVVCGLIQQSGGTDPTSANGQTDPDRYR